MVKLRITGTPQELNGFRKLLNHMAHRNDIEILDMSGMYANIDSDVFYRMYVQVRTKGKEERENENAKRMQGNSNCFTERWSR